MRVWGGAAGVAAAWMAVACSAPERPIFGPEQGLADTVPPNVEFLAPPSADSTFPAGTQIQVQVHVFDAGLLEGVAASVSGVMAFGFPPSFPNDTGVVIGYVVATQPTVTGILSFHVVATDTAGNRTDANRDFRIE